MSKLYDLSIYIGRFQPFHNAHQEVAEKALENSKRLLFVIGGDNSPRTIKNPFTVKERVDIILANLGDAPIDFISVRDYLYNDKVWSNQLMYKVSQMTRPDDKKIAITGSMKDASSYYLQMFPQWKQDLFTTVPGIDSTRIREVWFNPLMGTADLPHCTQATKDYILDFTLKNKEIKDTLDKEFNYIQGYIKMWTNSPFPVCFQTVDAVVFKAGHVLVIKRKKNPGKGLYALPGGFLDIKKRESLFEGSLRELDEETNIRYPKDQIINNLVGSKVFDHPDRSLRGRTITTAFNFDLGDQGSLPFVIGGDDAEEALWMPFHEVGANLDKFFEDHVHIIEYFMYKQGRV